GLIVESRVTTPEALQTLHWWLANLIQPIGRLFIRIIFMIVIPLIFSAIVLGIAEMGDLSKLGRVGLRAVLFTLLLSGTSVLVGLGLVNTLKPGTHLSEETKAALTEAHGGAAAQKVAQGTSEQPPITETLLELIPQNPLFEAVNAFTPNYSGGGLIAVMVFSLFFGIAMAMSAPDKMAPLTAILHAIFDVCMRIIGFAMLLAPIGVACLGFSLTATLGIDVVRSLGFYAAVVIFGLALHQFVSYSLFLKFIGGK